MLDGLLAVLIVNAPFISRWKKVHFSGLPFIFIYISFAWCFSLFPASVLSYSEESAARVGAKVASLVVLTDGAQTVVHSGAAGELTADRSCSSKSRAKKDQRKGKS